MYVVLEEDGTEVDEEEYFQTLPGKIFQSWKMVKIVLILHAKIGWNFFELSNGEGDFDVTESVTTNLIQHNLITQKCETDIVI